MTEDEHFKQIEENFRRAFDLLEALIIQVADVKATGERIESKLNTLIIDARTGFVLVGTESARGDRRLGNIENRVEASET